MIVLARGAGTYAYMCVPWIVVAKCYVRCITLMVRKRFHARSNLRVRAERADRHYPPPHVRMHVNVYVCTRACARECVRV